MWSGGLQLERCLSCSAVHLCSRRRSLEVGNRGTWRARLCGHAGAQTGAEYGRGCRTWKGAKIRVWGGLTSHAAQQAALPVSAAISTSRYAFGPSGVRSQELFLYWLVPDVHAPSTTCLRCSGTPRLWQHKAALAIGRFVLRFAISADLGLAASPESVYWLHTCGCFSVRSSTLV